MRRVMIMAGGTGGHVMPAIAVARCLRDRGVEVCWMGSAGGFELQLVSAEGFDIETIRILGLRGKSIRRKLIMPFLLLAACIHAFWILRRRQPEVLLGMGGFVAGPGGLVAGMMRKPLVLHEQNAVAGLTNRCLAGLSSRVLTGFPVAVGLPSGIWVGNPVRREITAIDPPSSRLKGRQGPLRLLVIGGSQGARIFNRQLPALLARRPETPLIVRHQVGCEDDVHQVSEAYRQVGIEAEVSGFIQDMATAYTWSDVMISRAGAMTVAEICAAGGVAFLVPYSHAVSDHQTRNAEYLTSAGAAFVVPEAAFSEGEWLADLAALAVDRRRLVIMGDRARALARVNAAERVADICGELVHA